MQAITFFGKWISLTKVCLLLMLLSLTGNVYAEYYFVQSEADIPPYQPAQTLPHSYHHGRNTLNIYVAYPCICHDKWLAHHCNSCKVDHWSERKFPVFYAKPVKSSVRHYVREYKKNQGFEDMSTGDDDARYQPDLQIN